MNTAVLNRDYSPNQHKAQRFTMRLVIVTVSMTFAAFTSYFIVRKGGGNWASFTLPSIFWMSTLVLVFSSLAIQMAHVANRRNHVVAVKLGLGLTVLLGAAFCVFQWLGWQELLQQGVFLSGGNDSGSIFYVITGAHALHVVIGLAFMLIALGRSFWLFDRLGLRGTFLDESNDKLRIRTDLLSVYWHFMGALWIYLFVFLYMNL